MFPFLSPRAKKLVILYSCSLESESGRSRSKRCILLMASEVNLEQALSKIPMVQEYLNVFLEDIPEFPPEREVKFFIDLVLGT